MQALVVAAGAGKRLGGNVPKPLIEINGKPLLINLIDLFRKEGIGDIVVITGYMKHHIEAALADFDVEIVFNPFYPVSDNLASFWVGRHHITGPCVVSHGDLIFDSELLRRLLKAPGDIILPMDRSSLDEEAMKIKIEKGVLVNLNKFIPPGEAAGESIPIMKFSEAALSGLVKRAESILEEGYFNRYIDDAVLDLTRREDLETHILDVTGLRWAEIDTREDLEKATRLFAESN